MKPNTFNYNSFTDLEQDLILAKAEIEQLKNENQRLKLQIEHIPPDCHDDGFNCNYDPNTDTCMHNKADRRKEKVMSKCVAGCSAISEFDRTTCRRCIHEDQCNDGDYLYEKECSGFIEGNVKHLRDLIAAEKDGRMVVLPCKDWLEIAFGNQTLFYGIDTSYVENQVREISVDNAERFSWYEGWETLYLRGTDENGFDYEFTPSGVGETIFLTREEAEAALRGEER